MKIFVAGGAGYIGSATAATLIEAGHEVTVYDSLVKGYKAAVPAGAKFIQADLADREALKTAMQSDAFDAVIQFAAFIEAGESMRTPGSFFRNNHANTVNLLDVMIEAGVKKIVFSSTAGIFASSDAPLSEDSPVGPASVYGQTKLMVEQTLEWYRQVYGLRYAALRYFNAAGALPGRGEAHKPESHLIPLVLQVALGQRQNIAIFGNDYPTPDGTNIRDYIHIRDLVSAHTAGRGWLGSARPPGSTTWAPAGAIPCVRSSRPPARSPVIPSRPWNLRARPGDAPRLVASSAKIRAELGWQPQMPELEEIIATAWEWHRTHPHGWG